MTPEEFRDELAKLQQRWAMQAACKHVWGTPTRALNRFGRLSAHLYGTTCTRCGKQEVRAGLARLKREVVERAGERG